MQEKIERLVQQLSKLQLRQTAAIEELQALGGSSTAGVRSTTSNNSENEETTTNSEHNTTVHCYDRNNQRISVNDRVYLLTKGRFKVRAGKVIRINCQTKWITIELDNTRQVTKRKSSNVRVESLQ